MDVKGLCVICGKPAGRSCGLCGALVCEDHYDSGLCSNCKAGRTA